MAAGGRNFLTPRILAPVLLWLVCLWLVHRYLRGYPLPVPAWNPQPQGTSSSGGPATYLKPQFPIPPPREGEDGHDSVNPWYRPFRPLPDPEVPFPVLRPTRFLPKSCLESWFIYGELSCSREELGAEDTLDATWLWVNGTDSRWYKEMSARSKELGIFSPAKHFREQNELKYSMRSVAKALKGHLGTLHLILYDYAFNGTTDLDLLPESTLPLLESEFGDGSVNEKGFSPSVERHLEDNWRIVQTPHWLNFSAVHASHDGLDSNNTPAFRYASHSEIFHLPSAENDDPERMKWKNDLWREAALPTYNSMAIKSRIGWLPGLADVSVALNDDFFMLRELSVSDFHSPFYGNVLRLDPLYEHQVKAEIDNKLITESGENGGLYHANWLLSRRYPKRLRPYFAHAPKVITRNLHHEASIMFKNPLLTSSTRKFREAAIGAGDIQIQWLLTMLRVERWREALLWTWTVANLGSASGMWDDESRQAIKDLFGLTEDDTEVAQMEVHRGERWTMRNDRVEEAFAQAGWDAPKATDYLFSSLDGHLPPLLEKEDPEANDVCVLDLDTCFGSFWTESISVPADEMFRRLTFERPECGDCLIMALVTASGPLGLSAVFPSDRATFYNPSSSIPPKFIAPPHLPLTSTWQEADFSLAAVIANTALPGQTVYLREYCMYLLSRYLYVSAKSPTDFSMLKYPSQARTVFDKLNNHRDIMILGLNDDIISGYDQVKAMMNEWFEERWPEPTFWER